MSDNTKELTLEERRAIATLARLAKRWPKSLWLMSANGELQVMRCGSDGEQVTRGEGMDAAYIVATIVGIPNDGGDW